MYSFGQLPHEIRYTTPAWNGSTDLVCLSEQGAGPLLPCGPVGCVIKNGDTGPYRSSYKTLVLRGIRCCDKLSVWLKGQCSFQFLLMVNQMVSSIEFSAGETAGSGFMEVPLGYWPHTQKGVASLQVLSPLFSVSSLPSRQQKLKLVSP